MAVGCLRDTGSVEHAGRKNFHVPVSRKKFESLHFRFLFKGYIGHLLVESWVRLEICK